MLCVEKPRYSRREEPALKTVGPVQKPGAIIKVIVD